MRTYKADIRELLKDFYRELALSTGGDPYATTRLGVTARWKFAGEYYLFIRFPFPFTDRIEILSDVSFSQISRLMTTLCQAARKLILEDEFKTLVICDQVQRLIRDRP